MFNTGLLMTIPLITLLISEIIQRGSIFGVINWVIHYPNQFCISYAILFSLINIFYLLPRKIYITCGFVFISLFSIAGFVSRQKLLLRGEPLLPWDIGLSKEALTITKSFDQQFPFVTVFFLLFVIIIVFILFITFLVPKEKYHPVQKISTALLSFLLFFSLTTYIPLENTFSLRLINWSQKSNYEENGMMLGFILNTKYLSVKEPSDYKIDNVNKIINKIETGSSYPIDQYFTPNVIFVMSEAFWDPTVLKEVSFSEDPLPFFHELQKQCTSGTLIAPVYGGGTANTEFEVLTGLSTKFLPPGIVPYVQFVHKPLEALPAIFKRQGYEATAIHTYDNWFYRRNIVYQNLGFDRFISKEFFYQPEYAGSYIRDTELSRKILEQIKKSNQPDFIYAISMQAHGPYSDKNNPDNSITVSGDLTPSTKAILENYTNIISDVDKSLKVLIDGLEELNEPSLVIFFGDHLPMLGNNFDVYREAGFFQDENSYEEYLKKYSVPLIVWDNFSDCKEDVRLSASFLGSYVLARSKKEGSPLTDFLYTLNEEEANVIVSSRYLDREKITEQQLNEYSLLQYDLLLGNEYTYQLKPLHKPKSNEVYTLGSDPITILEVLTPDEETLKVLGENFSPNCQIYVNDKPLETSYVNNSVLTATLPASRLYTAKDDTVIQVKITDSMENIISLSNIVSFSINP